MQPGVSEAKPNRVKYTRSTYIAQRTHTKAETSLEMLVDFFCAR